MLTAYDIPVVAGQLPTAQRFTLRSQQINIRGVVVDNANSTVQVNVYPADGAIGAPNIILPGWSRGFSVAGRASVWIVFTGNATENGNIHIELSSEPQIAFSTQVISEVQSTTFTSDYPDSVVNNANLSAGIWGGSGTTVGASPFTVDSFVTSASVVAIYVTSIMFAVASLVSWELAASGAILIPNYPVRGTTGPVIVLFGKPWFLSQGNGIGGTVNIVLTYGASGAGNVYSIQGYYL